MAIIAILAALLYPVLLTVREAARGTACVANLRQIGVGISAYATDNEGRIPYGPKAPRFTSPASLYPSTGAPTSLISLQNGAPVALGLILQYLPDPRVLFCPGSDQPVDALADLAKVGHTQAQSSYYYRHGGNTALFDSPRAPLETPNLRLANLGDNRQGKPIRALVIDSLFLCPPELEQFNVRPRTHHGSKFVNILFSDGHVATRQNTDAKYTADLAQGDLHAAFDKILTVLERADAEP